MTSFASTAAAYFHRAYQVAVAAPGSSAATAFGTFVDNGTNAKPAPLRVAFNIERNLKSSSNKASISLFNLQAQTRQALNLNSLVRVRAGYPGIVGTIFLGFCKKIKTERSGPDIVTSLECGDGEPYITYATVDKSYSTPVTLAQLLQDIADAMYVDFGGVRFKVSSGVVRGIPNKTYTRGFHLNGSCRAQLDKLLHPLHISWSVQDGRLFIIPRGATATTVAQVLSTTTGLVGVPSQNEKYVGFQSLLNPHIGLGSLVQLQTKNAQLAGLYKLRRINYQGDSHGGDWVCDCEGETVTNAYEVIPTAQGMAFSTAVKP